MAELTDFQKDLKRVLDMYMSWGIYGVDTETMAVFLTRQLDSLELVTRTQMVNIYHAHNINGETIVKGPANGA